MAVFTSKADHDVPFLTWVGQVDVNNLEEINLLLKRFFWNRAMGEDEIAPVKGLCLFGRSVLLSLYQHEGITEEQQERLTHYIDRAEVVSRVLTGAPDTATGIIPVKRLVKITTLHSIPYFERKMTTELSTLIDDIQGGKTALLACEECEHVFASKRSTRPRFCSHRCADRHSQRLRRSAAQDKKLLTDYLVH